LAVDDDWGSTAACSCDSSERRLLDTWSELWARRTETLFEHHADIGLVLSDLIMPAMTGSEAIWHILKNRPVRPSDVHDWDHRRTKTAARVL
jgi:CheY-like chemotaxis protein